MKKCVKSFFRHSQKRLAALLILLTIFPLALSAQTVTGTVTDAKSGEPLPGVAVLIRGTTLGAITNSDGSYSVNTSDANAVLVFSFVGYTTKEVPIAGQKVINLAMEEEFQEIKEIVVTGYGTRMKEELTGAVSVVSDKQMKLSTSPSVVSRMQGQISGITVTSANRPGGDATIRIRGIGTINDPNPLYVIDGVPTGPGNNVNPNDIESISVLKDASSAAIYGTRGANGVIIITTKRGRLNQKPTVTFSVRTGVAQAVNQYDLLNTEEYGKALWLQAKNNGTTIDHAQYGKGATPVIPDYILPGGAKEGDASVNPALYSYPGYVIFKANKTGTNWYDEIYRNGMIREYDLSISGGSKNSTYSMSANYLDEEGYLKNTSFDRFTFRINLDTKVNNWFKVGQSLQAIYISELGNLDDNGEGTVISQAYRSQPIIPVYDIMGNFAGSKAPEMGNSANPVAVLYRARNNNGKNMRAIGNLYAEATIFKGLTAKTLFGYNVGQWNFKGYNLPNYEHSEPNKVSGLNVNTNYSLLWNWSNTLTYNTTIADVHKINVIVGTEAVSSIYQEANASRSQYFAETPDYMQLNSGEINKDNNGYGSEWALFSQFGRVNYDLKRKYYLEGTVRRDGSSRFGANQRYGVFPAASAAWAVSEEGFMTGTKGWLDLLKIRAGWGKAGNDRIGDYNGFSTFSTNNYMAAYSLTGSNTSAIAGFQPAEKGNPDAKWEATTTLNLGIDATMLDRSLNLSFDVWSRTTTDMLYRLSIPEVMGLATPPFVNIGEMLNKGFDVELGYNNTLLGGKLTYAISATVSHYKNEVVQLSDKAKEVMGYLERQVEYTRGTTGRAFPEFYGFIVDGIYQSDEEAKAGPVYGTYNKAGHFMYRDLDGNDTISASLDRTYIGSPHPDFTGGLNIDLTYANFDLNVFFYGSYGNEMINYVARWIDFGMFNGGLSKDALYDSWTPENKGARLPMLDQAAGSQDASSHYIEDASFLRLKNLRLGYTVPQNVLSRVKIENLRLYVQATNLFTMTKYSGLDPEVNSSGRSMGVDRGAWPTPRQIMFGLVIGL